MAISDVYPSAVVRDIMEASRKDSVKEIKDILDRVQREAIQRALARLANMLYDWNTDDLTADYNKIGLINAEVDLDRGEAQKVLMLICKAIPDRSINNLKTITSDWKSRPLIMP